MQVPDGHNSYSCSFRPDDTYFNICYLISRLNFITGKDFSGEPDRKTIEFTWSNDVNTNLIVEANKRLRNLNLREMQDIVFKNPGWQDLVKEHKLFPVLKLLEFAKQGEFTLIRRE